MIKNKFIVPALAFGILVLGGTAFAFGPGSFDQILNLDGFTQKEQDAIQKSFEIRKTANEEAKKVLEDAGISMEKLHKAQKAQMDARKAQMDEIFKNGNYEAFLELNKDRPFAQDITKDQFDVMAQAHSLMEDGKRDEARALLEDSGIKMPGFGERGHGFQKLEGQTH